MKNLFLMAAVLVAYPVFAQEVQHAPTAEVCRADAAVWEFRFDSEKVKLSYGELYKRKNEMLDCFKSDPGYSPEDGATYSHVATLYSLEMAERAEDFIKRHGYTKQFFEEDAAGER